MNIFGDEKTMLMTRFTTIEWYNGYYGVVEQSMPQLALADDSGRIYLLRNERDQSMECIIWVIIILMFLFRSRPD